MGFDNEDDVLRLLLEREGRELYPKVTTIAQTRLAPDIDLLRIVPVQEAPLVGYECKVLNTKRNVLGPVYAGLGQVLCYFRYGLHQAWLVAGVPAEIPVDTAARLAERFRTLRECQIIPPYLGMRLIREDPPYVPDIIPEGTFHASSNDAAEYLRQSLLRGAFVWNKKMKLAKSG